ncbi:Hypothetical predicted protein [Paramuricea clavata]|uniref:Uncharacterized protein n=1 Tax=Paramuricea clavata TaxID=317549 RepID=A0A7D9IP25_PARCT|nr:Hypothetical predicted protein [Paramuricea clavata]
MFVQLFRRSTEDASMFADAEEFAHLLEDSGGVAQGGSEDVDMRGVSWKQQQWEMNRMRNPSQKNNFRGGKNRGRGSRNFGQGSAGAGKSSRNFGRGSAGAGKTSKNFGEGRKKIGKGRGKPKNMGNKRRKGK